MVLLPPAVSDCRWLLVALIALGVIIMPERSAVTQVVQIAEETVYGVAVLATKRLPSLSFDLNENITFREQRTSGFRVATKSIPGKKQTDVPISGAATYDEISYIMSGALKKVTPTTPGGATDARKWLFRPDATVEEVVSSFTVQKGSRLTLANQAVGLTISGFTLSGNTDEVNIAADGFAKLAETAQLSTNEEITLTVSGGTPTSGNAAVAITHPRTLAVLNVTTILFNTTASQAQTRFDLGIGAGNAVVTGGPWPGTPLTVEFIGEFGQINVATVTPSDTFDIGQVDAAVVTAGAAPTDVPQVPILPEHVKIYADPLIGDIGTTKLARVLSYSIPLTNLRGPLHVVDRDNQGSFVTSVDGPADTKFEISLVADAQERLFFEAAKVGDRYYFRWEAIGEEIDAGVNNYEVVIDFAAEVSAIGPYGEEQNVYMKTYTLTIVHEAGLNGFVDGYAQNTLQAL